MADLVTLKKGISLSIKDYMVIWKAKDSNFSPLLVIKIIKGEKFFDPCCNCFRWQCHSNLPRFRGVPVSIELPLVPSQEGRDQRQWSGKWTLLAGHIPAQRYNLSQGNKKNLLSTVSATFSQSFWLLKFDNNPKFRNKLW